MELELPRLPSTTRLVVFQQRDATSARSFCCPCPRTDRPLSTGPSASSLRNPRRPCFDLPVQPDPWVCIVAVCTKVYTHILQRITRTHMVQHPRPRCCLAIVVMIITITTTSTGTSTGTSTRPSKAGFAARYSRDCAYFPILACTAPLQYTVAELREGIECTVRTLGRPESLPADFAAQYRSVPVVNSALAAASQRTMCAQPPRCFASEYEMTFLRLLGRRPGVLSTSHARDLHAMPPILRVSGRPTDEHLPPCCSHAGLLDEPSHRTGRRRHRAGCRVPSRQLQPNPARNLPAIMPRSHPSGRLMHSSVRLAPDLLQGVS